jgi:hypothetical protein
MLVLPFDAELADGPYFVGDEFSAADSHDGRFTFTTMRSFISDYDLAAHPLIRCLPEAHRMRVPAYRKAWNLRPQGWNVIGKGYSGQRARKGATTSGKIRLPGQRTAAFIALAKGRLRVSGV